MIGLLLAVLAALGTFWLYSAIAYKWTGFGFGPTVFRSPADPRLDPNAWLKQAGLEDVDRREFAAVVGMLFILGAVVAFAAFGGPIPAMALGVFAASFPVAYIDTDARPTASAPKRHGLE